MSSEAKATAQSPAEHELGDESFMTADQLREYMNKIAMAHASQEVEAMDKAHLAREQLIKTLETPLDLTPAKLEEITRNLLSKLRGAAERGETEILVMRFPNVLCNDKGRAINNADPDWPDSLTGRPRQAYELWRDRLKPAGYRLKAMIVDWPGGLPGDVGFFLEWEGAPR